MGIPSYKRYEMKLPSPKLKFETILEDSGCVLKKNFWDWEKDRKKYGYREFLNKLPPLII